MDWGQVLTIIFGIAGFMSIFMLLINRQIEMVNKRIDDLRQDMDRRFEKLEKEMDRRFSALEQDVRELRQLLYKVLEVETKKEK
ncbi:hypothetical protein JCM9492_04530 [Aquifex pyrophilus]